jgi:hypothetical protein
MTPTLTPTEIAALQLFKSIAMRFIKGGLAGAAAAVGMITITAPTTWTALSSVLVALSYAAIVGFMSGGILAIEKYYNWTVTPSA